jgi:uncharacterized protein DUF4129
MKPRPPVGVTMATMAADRDPPTTTDYIVTALSPVLVMLMVGSLVFFLVEVLYAGKYSGRLLYTLFFFVMGAVLVARIAIETDPSRATLYGVLLGAVTYIALLTYVEYPGGGWLRSFGWLVNLGLMLLIWWSAHKLTWDCTHIDEKRKGADRGVLSAAGLDADQTTPSSSIGPISSNGPPAESKAKAKQKRKKPQPDSRLWDWIERYKKHRDARRKGPHTPGVWVIYFALAALPLFAIGQSLVDPADEARRRATFLQMAVYIASALGLLVTTSLLGLRRYLRQRKAKIPTALAGGWLGLGAVLILLFVVVGALLPRPHSEVPWFGISRAGKADREASKYAMRKDGAGKGEGASGDKSKAGDGKASGRGGKAGGGSKGEKGSGKGDEGKGGSGKKGDQSGGDEKGGGKGQGNEREAKKDEDGSKGEQSGDAEQNDESKDDGEGRDRNSSSQSQSQLSGALEKVAGVVRWIVFAIIAIVVVVIVVLAVLRYLAPFTGWAQRLLDALKNWWAGLWGKAKANPDRQGGGELQPVGPQRPPPFHAYSNPFLDGSAETRDLADLVAYSFDALDAWAWDQDAGRESPETPLEFLARLADLHPDLLDVLTRFAKVYARITYSDADPPPDTRPACEALWDGMVHGVSVGA